MLVFKQLFTFCKACCYISRILKLMKDLMEEGRVGLALPTPCKNCMKGEENVKESEKEKELKSVTIVN
jgi:hypothetical protein